MSCQAMAMRIHTNRRCHSRRPRRVCRQVQMARAVTLYIAVRQSFRSSTGMLCFKKASLYMHGLMTVLVFFFLGECAMCVRVDYRKGLCGRVNRGVFASREQARETETD